MFFRGNLSIKEEVFYIGLFFSIITLLVFGLLFSNYLSSVSVERAKNSIMERNSQISIFTEGVFTEVTNTLEVLSRNRDVINVPKGEPYKERALALYQDFFKANRNITFIYSGYEDGSILIHNWIPPSGFDSRIRPWYLAAVKNSPEQSIGLPYQDANTYEWLISQSKVLLNENGDFIGVMTIDLSLEDVTSLMDEDHLYASQHSFIMHQNGEIIIHSNKKLLGETVPTIMDGIGGREGELVYKEGERTMWAYYSTIDTTDWLIVTVVDRREVLQPIIGRIVFYALVVIVLATALGMLQSKIIGKRFGEPLMALGQRVEAITTGKSSLEVSSYRHSNHEIASIAGNIEELAEHSLHKKANELKTIIESTQDGILVVDEKRQVIYVNSRFKELWYIEEDKDVLLNDQEFIDSILSQLLKPQAFLEKVEELHASYRNNLDVLNFKDGRVYEIFSRPLIDEGQLLGRLWSFRDITERKQTEEKLRKMATADDLTGLWNRRYFMDAAQQELERARRYGQPFSLMILDLDYFKRVNDTLGHAAGDATLQHLASLMQNTLRDVDIPGRLGGEEFGVLLPATQLKDGVLVAERLRVAIEKNPARYEGQLIYFTASIGVTVYRQGITSVDDLFKEGDEALYQAKQKGRNCTVCADVEC